MPTKQTNTPIQLISAWTGALIHHTEFVTFLRQSEDDDEKMEKGRGMVKGWFILQSIRSGILDMWVRLFLIFHLLVELFTTPVAVPTPGCVFCALQGG